MPDTRRSFLRTSALIAGTALAGAGMTRSAAAAPLEIPPTARGMGRPIPPTASGVPSRFEGHVARRRTDVFVNRQNWSDWSMTPLQHQHGIVTPNGLIFERHHAGVPDVDPSTHKLAIHGMVKQPLRFTMNDLLRYPAVSKFHFLECSGNTLADWTKAASTTVQQTHGLLSGAQWTGVPAAWLLDEAGVQPGATWVLFEGADGASHTRSIPVDKGRGDVLLVYAQNGEMLRPEQGYPLRALIPGWEGNVSVKWLRRIKVGDQPWNFRSETARYTDPMPDGKWRQFSFVMECKSVITRPSGGMKLERPGLHEIQGFAWSGRGRITAVDVSAVGQRERGGEECDRVASSSGWPRRSSGSARRSLSLRAPRRRRRGRPVPASGSGSRSARPTSPRGTSTSARATASGSRPVAARPPGAGPSTTRSASPVTERRRRAGRP